MTDRFEQLLFQLGPIFALPLHPDKVGACSIAVNPHLKVQLQLDLSQEKIFFFSKIIEIPPGKFRENVLKESLKSNGLPDPLAGILAYFPITNHLVLYQTYPLSILNGERLAALISSFLEMGENWYQAIKNGQSSPQSLRPPPFGQPP